MYVLGYIAMTGKWMKVDPSPHKDREINMCACVCKQQLLSASMCWNEVLIVLIGDFYFFLSLTFFLFHQLSVALSLPNLFSRAIAFAVI